MSTAPEQRFSALPYFSSNSLVCAADERTGHETTHHNMCVIIFLRGDTCEQWTKQTKAVAKIKVSARHQEQRPHHQPSKDAIKQSGRNREGFLRVVGVFKEAKESPSNLKTPR